MTAINPKPLSDDLPFGVRIAGLREDMLDNAGARSQIKALFEERGLIVFEDVEPTSEMHVKLSTCFGPLKEHPLPGVSRADEKTLPGVIDIRHVLGSGGLVELGGAELANWLPWHFDHCYNNALNRAGVLRLLEIPPEGGLTGFADGIDLYRVLSPELRRRIEGSNIIYRLNLIYAAMRFGVPAGFREIKVHESAKVVTDSGRGMPRAIHPAVWTRQSGERVLHVSPWMAEGIEGAENPEGDALLDAVCHEMVAKVSAYFHRWKKTDMVVWDNWRMLHCVSGHDATQPRRMQRTTIQGDYGLGYFEGGGVGGALLEMTV